MAHKLVPTNLIKSKTHVQYKKYKFIIIKIKLYFSKMIDMFKYLKSRINRNLLNHSNISILWKYVVSVDLLFLSSNAIFDHVFSKFFTYFWYNFKNCPQLVQIVLKFWCFQLAVWNYIILRFLKIPSRILSMLYDTI